ncbi:peptidoglycan DD-metalloendopeptidase family protein [Polaribacter pectinis]|uniref:Peptidoglycan DD-metalloendopeptidase family protein n=1 Tax=Polaribacter pectinis TaxID=2738844 RepID=A0A7G9L9A2_9FLAO|nr:peptidoglycan DD-metalloendopeptidase family protein [Polaribacter pectinis]QNM85201.1 peptidoglycan DD-metalloendopeptidase family protein [Polaribacter pectinis]
MINSKLHIALFILFFSCFSVFSQTRKQLEAQRKQLKKEIQQVNSLLFKEKKKEQNALEELKDINQKIEVRNKLISTINLEAALLSKEIKKNEKNLKELNDKLTALKADYADMIFKSYKSKSQQSRTMFLLSSQNFYQAYKRLEYMKQYTSFRKKQGEEIGVQADLVEKLNDSLLYKKREKDTLILSEKDEKLIIESDKKNQERLLSTIKKKENKYKRDLKNKIEEERKVAKKIDKIIRDEIEKANRIARAKLKTKPKSTKKNEFILSPEAKALAANFELNKGKLPWPVKEGIIVRRFGKQPHPTFPGITVNGTGLHIVTQKANNAQAIFNGVVLNVLVSSEGRKNVLIQHGNYISSYNNLERTFVKKGDKIKTGQKIGTIFTDKVSGKTKLIFVLFKNTTRLNPSTWILKR